MGIDEAGRGAVLGPMTYGMSLCPVSSLDKLKSMGFNDSKQLTAKKRDDLFKVIRMKCEDWMAWEVHVITPQNISESSYAKGKYSLNDLSHDSAIELIQRALDKGANITKLFIDTVGRPEFYRDKLQRRFPMIPDITVESKADDTYPITSAASICAKVYRDELMECLQCTEDGIDLGAGPDDWGCGYPSDEKTQAWLKNHHDKVFGFCSVVRFNWGPVKTLMKELDDVVDIDFGDESDDDDEDSKLSSKKRAHASAKIRPGSFFEPKRARFFEERRIDLVKMF